MSLATKLFGTYSQRQLKKLKVIADQVDALADKYRAMSNAELQAVTPALKARLAEARAAARGGGGGGGGGGGVWEFSPLS